MKSGLNFLVAALRCEIDELDQLARTSELVGTIGRLVHELQRERGISNVFLASRGRRFENQRNAQIGECLRAEQAVRAGFDLLESDAGRIGNGARLFSRVAWVLPGFDALPELRRRVGAMELDAAAATTAFVKLVAGNNDERMRVYRTNGVFRIVSMRGELIPVPDEQIEALRAVVTQQVPWTEHPFLKIGQRVRIRGGSLEGVEGVLLSRNGDRTLIISVDAIQRSLAVRVEGYDVEAL